MNTYCRLFVFICLFCSFTGVLSQENSPLFSSDEVLDITIKLAVNDLIDDRINRKEQEARLTISNADGTPVHLNIKLKVRGLNRAKMEVCDFPPLTVNLKKKETSNTVFESQNKLKLVTHCRNTKSFQDYIFKEYLVYKLYQELTAESFGVRLCKITYIDTKKGNAETIKYGFLIEDVDDVAKRNLRKEWDDVIASQQACQKSSLENLTFFQYMIGNLDWSIPHRHNIKLIVAEDGGLPIPIPYDFDASGFVNAPYAEPPAQFQLPSVRSRLFWGLCRAKNGYDRTVSLYKEKKDELYSIVTNFDLLSEKAEKSTIKYLDGFYKIINDEKLLFKKTYKACRADHKHLYE